MISQFKNRFWKCSAGAVAVMTALVLPVLLGFTSLGVEVGHWYLDQRQMQGAADAAAISAAAEFITNINGTTYQPVGVNYALTNGFTIPINNVCLIPTSGGTGNCGTVLALDPRTIPCPATIGSTSWACVVVEITQNTALWPSTKASLEPTSHIGRVQAIPTPTLKARAVVAIKVVTTPATTTTGTDCILALANDPAAVTVHGGPSDTITADCGIAIDGGRDQNVNGTPLGGITFNGQAKVNIGDPIKEPVPLIVASNSTNCPSSHCFWDNPSTTPLPASAVKTNTATPDPYAAQIATIFQTPPPLGVKTGGVVVTTGKSGAGYTNGTRTFTVVGGTGTPAKFTATVASGKVTAILSVIDPGAYTVFPTGTSVQATPDTGSFTTAANFTLTEGCFTWISGGTPFPGRKYCSINLQGSGTTNFPAGNYYIAGGDSGCVGFCVSSNNATVTSDDAGVTFFLTNGEGTGTYGTGSYATVSIQSGTISLCAPGTNTGNTKCTGANPGTTCNNTTATSCMLFIQNPAATTSTSIGTPSSTTGGTSSPNTDNSFAGNGTRTLSGLIYLPKQTFDESGNGPILGCFGVIAKYIDVGGTPTFSNGCLPGNGIGGTTTPGSTTASSPRLYQ